MRVLIGTSGYGYDEWHGPFYPAELRAAERLAYYAQRLAAVEINNTFYRMPRSHVLDEWAAQVPDGFRFALKASRRITHQARLLDAEEAVGWLWRSAQHLGEHLGPILFQLPPFFKKDVARLAAFCKILPDGCRAAFEFRHPSWDAAEVHTVLRDAGHALCHADADEDDSENASEDASADGGDVAGADASDRAGAGAASAEPVATARFGYLRLRRSDYDDAALDRIAASLRARPWDEAWVFFKHEAAGAAPAFAARLAARCAAT